MCEPTISQRTAPKRAERGIEMVELLLVFISGFGVGVLIAELFKG
jgi:hypothetical protein